MVITDFIPYVIYNDDEHDPYVEYVKEDAPVYHDRVDDVLELIRHMETKTIVGARIYCKISLVTSSGSRSK